MDVSEKIIGHGHVDNTSFIMSAYGQRILVDSGGPYSYDTVSEMGLGTSFKTAYFRTAAAHNLLQMDGLDFDADTNVVKITDAPDHAAVLATHAGYANTTVSRQMIVLKDGVVLAFDRADTQQLGSHTYTLNWHFDPNASGLEAAASTDFAVGSAFVDAAFVTGSTASYELISGRLGADPQGWVATGLYAAIPAPVLAITQTANDAWFVSGFAVAATETPVLAMAFDRTLDGYSGFVTHGNLGWQVEADDLGNTSVVTFQVDAATLLKTGTDGDNSLSYTATNDLIIAKAGNDTIQSRDGNDRIFAGDGNDTVYAGNGNDQLSGGRGADTLRSGDGDDTLRGDDGDDKLIGDAGNDRLDGGAGNDSLVGDYSATSLVGGNDILNGGSGTDLLRGLAGDDILNGGAGIDRLFGGYGADIFVFDDTAFSGRDIVADFNIAQGDSLLLDAILFGYDPLNDLINEFVRITENVSHSYLSIDRDGAENGLSFVQIAALSNVHGLTDEAQLLADGVLRVDHLA